MIIITIMILIMIIIIIIIIIMIIIRNINRPLSQWPGGFSGPIYRYRRDFGT